VFDSCLMMHFVRAYLPQPSHNQAITLECRSIGSEILKKEEANKYLKNSGPDEHLNLIEKNTFSTITSL
jgi:hypothetical protein